MFSSTLLVPSFRFHLSLSLIFSFSFSFQPLLFNQPLNFLSIIFFQSQPQTVLPFFYTSIVSKGACILSLKVFDQLSFSSHTSFPNQFFCYFSCSFPLVIKTPKLRLNKKIHPNKQAKLYGICLVQLACDKPQTVYQIHTGSKKYGAEWEGIRID